MTKEHVKCSIKVKVNDPNPAPMCKINWKTVTENLGKGLRIKLDPPLCLCFCTKIQIYLNKSEFFVVE